VRTKPSTAEVAAATATAAAVAASYDAANKHCSLSVTTADTRYNQNPSIHPSIES